MTSSALAHRGERIVLSTCTHGGLSVAGLFAGIGGIELGFQRAGLQSRVLYELWEPARAVLNTRFPDIPIEEDVRDFRTLPAVDVVTAGFPCTDLSQAGRTAGIFGQQSSLVGHVFRLLDAVRNNPPRWLVIENVRNMLSLDRGRAMKYLVDQLDRLGYRWAYRLVDSRSSGVPQRRQRVLLVASKTEDPRGVLFADEAGERAPEDYMDDAYGFYWTEGLRGLGWALDAVPTFKGGSTLGIPSPPGIWLREAVPGRSLVQPTIQDAEELQGFPRDWTDQARSRGRNGPRWRLVGNAVTVGVAEWLGRRLADPGEHDSGRDTPHSLARPWPNAAWGEGGCVWRVDVSMWPTKARYRHLRELIDVDAAEALSHRAATGFFGRTQRSKLRFDPEFLVDVKRHVEATAE